MPVYLGLLELDPLTSEAERRKLRIEDCPKEYQDCVLRFCLEEVDRRWGLGDLV